MSVNESVEVQPNCVYCLFFEESDDILSRKGA